MKGKAGFGLMEVVLVTGLVGMLASIVMKVNDIIIHGQRVQMDLEMRAEVFQTIQMFSRRIDCNSLMMQNAGPVDILVNSNILVSAAGTKIGNFHYLADVEAGGAGVRIRAAAFTNPQLTDARSLLGSTDMSLFKMKKVFPGTYWDWAATDKIIAGLQVTGLLCSPANSINLTQCGPGMYMTGVVNGTVLCGTPSSPTTTTTTTTTTPTPTPTPMVCNQGLTGVTKLTNKNGSCATTCADRLRMGCQNLKSIGINITCLSVSTITSSTFKAKIFYDSMVGQACNPFAGAVWK